MRAIGVPGPERYCVGPRDRLNYVAVVGAAAADPRRRIGAVPSSGLSPGGCAHQL